MADTPRSVKLTITVDARAYIRGMRRVYRALRRQAALNWWQQHGHILIAGLVLGAAAGVNVSILLAATTR